MENSNKIIVINSIILYGRLGLLTIIGLLTTRFALEAIGVNDFGLFSLLGSVIAFTSILNSIMLSTSNRFIAVAIGKNDVTKINEKFNICLILHIIIAILTIVVALPIGRWYILNYLNFKGSIDLALNVYYFCTIGAAISFISVPYNGLLMAKENFLMFSLTDVFTHICKLGIAYSLLFYFEDKLMIYAVSQSILTAVPTVIYLIYSKYKYPTYVQFKIVKNISEYKPILNFSGWVAYGAVATIGRSQGAAILVNLFFNTVMNAALGIANTVNSLITSFSQNISSPMAPQITKSYAKGDINRTTQLLLMSTKFTFLVMLFISAPFLLTPELIFGLWLGEIPPYVIEFTIFIIIDALVSSLNAGVSSAIFASGKIKAYQLSVNTLRLAAVGLAFILLHKGFSVNYLFYSYILISIVNVIVSQIILHKELNLDNKILVTKSYLPSIIIVTLFTPFIVFELMTPVLKLISGMLYLVILMYLIGLEHNERNYLRSIFLKFRN